jgi:hypothetical protein
MNIRSAIFALAAGALLTGPAVFAQMVTSPVPLEPLSAQEVEALTPQDTYSLPWGRIDEKDILWKKRVWRQVDFGSPANASGQESHSPDYPRLINTLIGAVSEGKIIAYAATNDRFTDKLSKEDFIRMIDPGNTDPGTAFNPGLTSALGIKEDWLFLKSEKKIVVRIIGIEPLCKVTHADGTTSQKPAFWLYYPDCRTLLAAHKAGTEDNALNWDQFFEGRHFSSSIYKISEHIDYSSKAATPASR